MYKTITELENELKTAIIKDLIESNFSLRDDEAYNTILSKYPDLIYGRVGSVFLRLLGILDWDEIENSISEIVRAKLMSDSTIKIVPIPEEEGGGYCASFSKQKFSPVGDGETPVLAVCNLMENLKKDSTK